MTASMALRLESEGAKTAAFFRELPKDCWETTVYTEGAVWSIREVLAHFVAAEIGMQELVQDIVGGGAGVPETFDIDRYNQSKVNRLAEVAPQDLLTRFENVRRSSCELVRALSDQDLRSTGRHPWLGMTTVEEIIKLLYVHNQIHVRDIRRVVAGASQS